jgi:hypothetical protein
MITSYRLEMIGVKTITAIAANNWASFSPAFPRVFGPAHDDTAERLGSLARSTIECLADDALCRISGTPYRSRWSDDIFE